MVAFLFVSLFLSFLSFLSFSFYFFVLELGNQDIYVVESTSRFVIILVFFFLFYLEIVELGEFTFKGSSK